MQNENPNIFKPKWIPELLSAVLSQRQHSPNKRSDYLALNRAVNHSDLD